MRPRIAFFDSEPRSADRSGAETLRGLFRELYQRGCDLTFYVPDGRERTELEDPDFARVVVWEDDGDLREALREAERADVVIKASGVLDGVLDREVLGLRAPRRRVVFWDVDAPTTLERVRTRAEDPLRVCIPRYDRVFTHGGGPGVVQAYEALGAKRCVPVHAAHDPRVHHPVTPDPRFEADLACSGDRVPDQEEGVRELLFGAAEALPHRSFLLAGDGWEGARLPRNVRWVGPVHPRDRNALHATPKMVLDLTCDGDLGWSPSPRLFEAAAAGACLLTRPWRGLEDFFAPWTEILVARDALEVIGHLEGLGDELRSAVGAAARRRALADHTWARRVGRLGSAHRREAA